MQYLTVEQVVEKIKNSPICQKKWGPDINKYCIYHGLRCGLIPHKKKNGKYVDEAIKPVDIKKLALDEMNS